MSSDGGDSPVEITAEDFHGVGGGGGRVWTAADLMPYRANFGPNLYNYAWAQAVQNKPLMPAVKLADVVVSDDVEREEEDEEGEKEEGEIEEGEIELGGEPPFGLETEPIPEKTDVEVIPSPPEETEAEEMSDGEIGEFDRRVSLILEDLENVTEEEAKISLEVVCARVRKSIEALKQMHSESQEPVLDALVQQAIMGMQTVHAVVVESKLKKNEDLFLRLLIHIKNHYSVLLTSDQLKELDEMVRSLVYSDNKGNNMNANSSHGLVSSAKQLLDQRAVGSSASTNNFGSAANTRKAVDFSPLLDLHADHDEFSLPSPTRATAPPLPLQSPIGIGLVLGVPAELMPAKSVEDRSFKPYDTDAFKAVSSYQQKYSGNSFPTTNQFPSPTPSEENDGDGNDDIHSGEVSSTPAVFIARDVNSASSSQFIGSSYNSTFTSTGLQSAAVKTPGPVVSAPPAAVKFSANNRDPRLRMLKPEVVGTSQNRPPMPVISNPPSQFPVGFPNARKHKAIEEPMPNGHNFKRPRNGLADSRDVQLKPGRGGWLEDSNALAPQLGNRNMQPEYRNPRNGAAVSNQLHDAINNFHGTNGGVGQNLSVTSAPAVSMSTSPAVSLPSLLRDIALNPTMLLQLVQRQALAPQSQLKTADSGHNLASFPYVNGFPSTVSSQNGSSLKTVERDHTLAEKSQLPSQTASSNDIGTIRMKPRDPRRILHNNNVPKPESLKSEPAKINANLSTNSLSSTDWFTVRDHGERTQTSGLPYQPSPQLTSGLPSQPSQPAPQHIPGLPSQPAQASTSGLHSQSTPAFTSGLPSQSALHPDIATQFTRNLKSVADMISSTPPVSTLLSVPQTASQSIPSKTNNVGAMTAAVDLNDNKSASGLSNEGGMIGVTQEPNPWGDVDHLLDGYDDQQKADIQRERYRRIEEQNKMFAARKLCLVLDLDHTLLNSAKFIEVDPAHEEILRKKEEVDREKPHRHLFRFPYMGMWTKLRPGVWNFLDKASKLFELHLYTMGNKLYATEMAKVLDPTGALFAGRVISRGDDNDLLDGDERVPKTKDLDGVLGLESAVVIVDDSVRVWPHNKLNLIVVERYTYFPCSRRQFGLPGPSLLEIDHDERPEAGTLASSLAVIERVHTNFFSHRSLHDVDVRNILATEQRKILGGCKIVFSRIFPVGEVNPQTHPLWQTAEQFGAVCTNQIDEYVTHVVANSLGTDKVNWALSTGRFVVQPGWVEASALLYRRANEHDFSVKN